MPKREEHEADGHDRPADVEGDQQGAGNARDRADIKRLSKESELILQVNLAL